MLASSPAASSGAGRSTSVSLGAFMSIQLRSFAEKP
jgi:hypothetical protein